VYFHSSIRRCGKPRWLKSAKAASRASLTGPVPGRRLRAAANRSFATPLAAGLSIARFMIDPVQAA
jgi:hypothetical protein